MIFAETAERKVEASSAEAGQGLSCRRENHPRDMFISLQVEVDRFLLRIFISVAQEDAESLLIGSIFDSPADRDSSLHVLDKWFDDPQMLRH